MPPRHPSLAEVAAGRVGVIKSARVMAFMIQWQLVRDDLGHEPTLEEYGEWWNASRSTSFREQALFRQAFPGETNPTRLLDATSAAWATRAARPSPRFLGSVPFPA